MNDCPLSYSIAHVPEPENGESLFVNGKFNTITKKAWADSLEQHPFNVYYVYHFNAHFKHGLNVVKHSYDYDLSYSIDQEYYFPYVLTAANRWANKQIDDFTLTIDMGAPESYSILPTFFKDASEWTFTGKGRCETTKSVWGESKIFHIQSGIVRFSKKNFHPEGELEISKKAFVMWYWDEDGKNAAFFWDSKNENPKAVTDLFKECYVKIDTSLMSAVIFNVGRKLSKSQKRALRNLPFAYRGYVFKNKTLKKFYETSKWYMPNLEYVVDLEKLSADERKWVEYWSK